MRVTVFIAKYGYEEWILNIKRSVWYLAHGSGAGVVSSTLFQEQYKRGKYYHFQADKFTSESGLSKAGEFNES